MSIQIALENCTAVLAHCFKSQCYWQEYRVHFCDILHLYIVHIKFMCNVLQLTLCVFTMACSDKHTCSLQLNAMLSTSHPTGTIKPDCTALCT
jgi:hypothetical protein